MNCQKSKICKEKKLFELWFWLMKSIKLPVPDSAQTKLKTVAKHANSKKLNDLILIFLFFFFLKIDLGEAWDFTQNWRLLSPKAHLYLILIHFTFYNWCVCHLHLFLHRFQTFYDNLSSKIKNLIFWWHHQLPIYSVQSIQSLTQWTLFYTIN